MEIACLDAGLYHCFYVVRQLVVGQILARKCHSIAKRNSTFILQKSRDWYEKELFWLNKSLSNCIVYLPKPFRTIRFLGLKMQRAPVNADHWFEPVPWHTVTSKWHFSQNWSQTMRLRPIVNYSTPMNRLLCSECRWPGESSAEIQQSSQHACTPVSYIVHLKSVANCLSHCDRTSNHLSVGKIHAVHSFKWEKTIFSNIFSDKNLDLCGNSLVCFHCWPIWKVLPCEQNGFADIDNFLQAKATLLLMHVGKHLPNRFQCWIICEVTIFLHIRL